MNLRDTGDLAAASRGPRFAVISDHVNDNPSILLGALVKLRINVSYQKTRHFRRTYGNMQTYRRSWISSNRRRITLACKFSDTAISQRRVRGPSSLFFPLVLKTGHVFLRDTKTRSAGKERDVHQAV